MHSMLLCFHCLDFTKWLERHNCTQLPGVVDLRESRLSKRGVCLVADWVYEMSQTHLTLDFALAFEGMQAAAYFRVDALLRVLQDYSLQVTTFISNIKTV